MAKIVANQLLETDLEKLKAAVSIGYARGKLFEPVPRDRKDWYDLISSALRSAIRPAHQYAGGALVQPSPTRSPLPPPPLWLGSALKFAP
jgi:hypothetical protein